MPITSANIKLKLSTTSGTRGNQIAQGSPNSSLGKYMSTTDIVDNTLDNLFDDISGNENASGIIDYRNIFIENTHATLTYQAASVYISTQSTAIISIGLDPSGVFAVDSSTPQATTISNELHAPQGVSFSTPLTAITSLTIGDITPSGCIGLWVKRTAPNGAALNNDTAQLSISGDTSA